MPDLFSFKNSLFFLRFAYGTLVMNCTLFLKKYFDLGEESKHLRIHKISCDPCISTAASTLKCSNHTYINALYRLGNVSYDDGFLLRWCV